MRNHLDLFLLFLLIGVIIVFFPFFRVFFRVFFRLFLVILLLLLVFRDHFNSRKSIPFAVEQFHLWVKNSFAHINFRQLEWQFIYFITNLRTNDSHILVPILLRQRRYQHLCFQQNVKNEYCFSVHRQ